MQKNVQIPTNIGGGSADWKQMVLGPDRIGPLEVWSLFLNGSSSCYLDESYHLNKSLTKFIPALGTASQVAQ